MNLEFREVEAGNLDLIAPLWDKLRKHQEVLSPHFSQHYANRTWEARKAELLGIAKSSELRIDVALDAESRQIVGYCVSAISPGNKGCVESIFVEPACRGSGVGDSFMAKAIAWMKSKEAKTIVLDVGVGNEAVLSFYNRYGFYPRTIVLQQTNRAQFMDCQLPKMEADRRAKKVSDT